MTTDKGQAAVDVDVIGRPLAAGSHGAGDDDGESYDWGEAS